MNSNVIVSHFPHSPLMPPVESCCAAMLNLFFLIALKLSYFCKKKQKFRVLRSQTPKTAPHCKFLATRLIAVTVLRAWTNPHLLKSLQCSCEFFRIIELRSCDQGCRKNDAFTLPATLPTKNQNFLPLSFLAFAL